MVKRTEAIAKLVQDLKALKEKEKRTSDFEKTHVEADKLLLEFISDENVWAAYDDLHRWYA